MSNQRRIVVTGIGVISSIGIGIEGFWKNLIAGKSGISKISSFDTTKFRTHKAGEAKNFNPHKFMKNPQEKGRATQLLLAVIKMAIKDSHLDLPCFKPSDIGVIVGTTSLEPQDIEKITNIRLAKGIKGIPPSLIGRSSIDMLATTISCEFGLRGFNMIISTACAAGNYAIGYGYDLLKQGRAKIMFCGGSESLSRIAFTGFNRLFVVAPDKCRPFDKNRRGMMLGEGAGVLVLETLKDALKRKAPIYAELLGYGMSCDAYDVTIPSKDGISKVMERTIKNCRIKKDDVDYINAHGTGTINNDRAETGAIRAVFGSRVDNIPVTSIKSMIGHTFGAAGAIESASCCLTIRDGIIPPTINFKTFDPECNINLVANEAKRKRIDIAMNNSFAFGGNNACVAFGRLKK